MSTQPRQLVFDLPLRSANGMEDFFVSQSNRAAVDLVDRWPDWPHWAAIVVGPEGSGKSHIANVWKSGSGAAALPASMLDEEALDLLQQHSAMLVEDVDRTIADERILFHLLNMAREHHLTVLMTSRVAPGTLQISLPDLRSRMRAVPLIAIAPPDEALIKAVLVKLFADRQLLVEPRVVNFIALRIERSMASVNAVVEQLDREALVSKRRVTRALAADVLGATGEADEATSADPDHRN
ncbi:MAG: HdaA/DnaA family protein [Hyphomicrobiaceae bacterium]